MLERPNSAGLVRWVAILLMLGLLVFESLSASHTSSPQEKKSKRLTNADIIEMHKAGISAEVMVAKIRNSDCAFDTSLAGLRELKAAGVPTVVAVEMVEAPFVRGSSVGERPETEVSPAPVAGPSPKDMPAPGLRVLRVVVTDGRLRLVRGLREEHFRLYEERVEQRIRFFFKRPVISGGRVSCGH